MWKSKILGYIIHHFAEINAQFKIRKFFVFCLFDRSLMLRNLWLCKVVKVSKINDRKFNQIFKKNFANDSAVSNTR